MALKITSKQTTIKICPHKGEEKYVMKVDHLTSTREIKDTLNVTLVRRKRQSQ